MQRYPKDRTVRNQKGRSLYLQAKYQAALAEFEETLKIDAEDLNAHYNAMLCFKALGKTAEAVAEEKWYRYFKDDERAKAVMADFRQAHPFDNRESLPVHVHDEPAPAEAMPPDWISEIGPKGYEYKGKIYETPKLTDDRPSGA